MALEAESLDFWKELDRVLPLAQFKSLPFQITPGAPAWDYFLTILNARSPMTLSFSGEMAACPVSEYFMCSWHPPGLSWRSVFSVLGSWQTTEGSTIFAIRPTHDFAIRPTQAQAVVLPLNRRVCLPSELPPLSFTFFISEPELVMSLLVSQTTIYHRSFCFGLPW